MTDSIFPAPAAAATPLRKYGFPRVVITGTQICCGLRPLYLDNAKQNYKDEGYAPSPYHTAQQIIFGMCYFSRFMSLHQYANRNPPEGAEGNEAFRFIDVVIPPSGEKFGSMYPGGGAVNFRHWLLNQTHGLLITHYETTCDTIQSYISANNLGTVVATGRWLNKNTHTWLKTLIWHWNGLAPTPESCGLTDFPFDVNGRLIAGRSNFRNAKNETILEEVVAA